MEVKDDWILPVKISGGWKEVSASESKAALEQSQFCKVYDRIVTRPDRVELLDFSIPAYLDAVPNFRSLREHLESLDDLASLMLRMSAALKPIPLELNLWEWKEPHDAKHGGLTELYRSCNLPGFKVARFTKMLHRKRPHLVPILDDYVMTAWGVKKGSRWTSEKLADITLELSDELGKPQMIETLDRLAGTAAELGEPWSRLSKLRLYDIVSYWTIRDLRGTQP